MDKKQFMRLYYELSQEPVDKLDEISEFAFTAFDTNHTGKYFWVFFNKFDLVNIIDLFI